MTEIPIRAPGVLGDRYEIQDLIGRGGMADVYRARDRMLDRTVAVKLMRSVSSTGTERARFTDEARTLARLDHPGLVTVLDAATTADQPYLVMELIRGPSLAECCRGVALEPSRVAAIGARLAQALEYAHSQGIVHRDLKPSNVLLGADGRVLLTDFGIARLMSNAIRHTAVGDLIGTAAYLAPEQVRGTEVSPATDVYSLGLVLLEALTGERTYQGPPTEAALARLSGPPPIPGHLPSAWQSLLRNMTAQQPADRPSTDQIAATLQRLAAGLVPAAATAELRAGTAPFHSGSTNTAILRPDRPNRRRWWVAALGGVAVLFVVAIVIAVTAVPENADQTGPTLPDGVAPELEQPLQDLHDAVEGR